MSRNLCTRATPRWQSAGAIRTVAGQQLLRNLLGQVNPGELLDPQVIRQVEESCNDWLLVRAKGEEGLFDLLRELGPMP